MDNYLRLLREILEKGEEREDRTATGTLSLFGRQMEFDLSQGFPLLTTKKLHLRSIIYELLWFLRGDSNIAYLHENKVSIWDEWADAQGELGPIYGKQWRSWPDYQGGTIDQISNVINAIKTEPFSRRLIVSSWNVAQLESMALAPCHCLFQFYVSKDRLSLHLYQRSGDIFLGVPFNIASYALLTMMIAQICHLKLGRFIHSFGDVHLYKTHIEAAKEQLTRRAGPLPQIHLDPTICDIFAFDYEHFRLENYHPLPHIKANVAI